jgi:hypothetical protein
MIIHTKKESSKVSSKIILTYNKKKRRLSMSLIMIETKTPVSVRTSSSKDKYMEKRRSILRLIT